MTLTKALEELEVAFAPSQQSEKLAQAVLERYWWLLWLNSSRQPLDAQATFSQIPIGLGDREYIPDFLVLFSPEPNPWFTTRRVWRFIELEPPSTALLTKSGSLSRRIRDAYEQTLDWNQWLETHRSAELLWASNSPIIQYSIFAGRRSLAEESDGRRVSSFVEANRTARLELHTYDYLLERAREMGEETWNFYEKSSWRAFGRKEFKKKSFLIYDSENDAFMLRGLKSTRG